MTEKPTFNKREEDRGRHLKDYWPLFVLIAVSALAAYAAHTPVRLAAVQHTGPDNDSLQMLYLMHLFMGFFLISFAMLKLFNPSSFADGFQMYDLLAKRVRAYAYIYPYIELGLGLGYLSFYWLYKIYIATIVVFAFSALGVLSALWRRLDINCPCMGTILKVPLSTVTLTEDLVMIAMACWMFFSF